MADLITINVAGGDTFGSWVATTNNAIDRVNSISPNANTVSANTVTTDLVFANTVSANVVNVTFLDAVGSTTTMRVDNLSVLSNTTFSGAIHTINSDNLTVAANTIFSGAAHTINSDNLTVAANTNLQGITTQAGLLTAATDIAGAINEVNDNGIAYAIALG
jgi:hypothetical protein